MLGIDEGDYEQYFPKKDEPKSPSGEQVKEPERIPTSETVKNKDRYVKKHESPYLWDTKTNKFTGFNAVDPKSNKPFYDPNIAEAFSAPIRDDAPFDMNSDEYKNLVNIYSFLRQADVPQDQLTQIMNAVTLSTMGDANSLSTKLWNFAQEYGFPREKLLEQLS
jgi:hypothetical protein